MLPNCMFDSQKRQEENEMNAETCLDDSFTLNRDAARSSLEEFVLCALFAGNGSVIKLKEVKLN